MDIKINGNTSPAPAYFDRSAAGDASAVAQLPAAPAAQADALVQQAPPAGNPAQVTQAVKNINKSMQAQGLEFSIDDSDRTIVKVVDRETGDVIRQMPSKEALEIAQALERAQGLLISQKA